MIVITCGVSMCLRISFKAHLSLNLLFSFQEQNLLKPPAFQMVANPMGRRASDGGANIQLFAQV